MPRPVANPKNPWRSAWVDLLEPAPPVALQVYEEEAKSILSRNDSPDIPFTWSVNPYRGCFHACAYCYARPTHQYLDWGAGTDFDRRIVVKTNAAALLEAALARRSWRRELVAFSGVTDCYQPLEASYGITRACLEVCRRRRNPVAVVTKGALVERDAELLAAIEACAGARVFVSMPFLDERDSRAIEPFAPSPARRLQTMTVLAGAGVPVGVAVAPIIPGLNDHQIPAILQAARQAGARFAFRILLRLPGEARVVFEERLREAFPQRARKVLSLLSAMRDGNPDDGRFGHRMRGEGPRWEVVEQLFDLHARRLGLCNERRQPAASRPASRQGELF